MFSLTPFVPSLVKRQKGHGMRQKAAPTLTPRFQLKPQSGINLFGVRNAVINELAHLELAPQCQGQRGKVTVLGQRTATHNEHGNLRQAPDSSLTTAIWRRGDLPLLSSHFYVLLFLRPLRSALPWPKQDLRRVNRGLDARLRCLSHFRSATSSE